jgi:hypothetical protein
LINTQTNKTYYFILLLLKDNIKTGLKTVWNGEH